MMNKKAIKEFLKPDWRKVIMNRNLILLIIVAIMIGVLVTVFTIKYETQRENENITEKQGFPVYYVDFRGNFSVSEPFEVDKTTKIAFSIYPTVDSYNTTIRFGLPAGIELAEGKLEWNLGNVKGGEKKEVTISVRPIEDIIHRNIHAFVRAFISPNLSEEIERSYAYLVSTTEEKKINFRANYSLSEPFWLNRTTMKVNKTIDITFSIFPDMDSHNTTIIFDLPPEIELVKGRLKWSLGDIKAGEMKEVNISVKVTKDFLPGPAHDLMVTIQGKSPLLEMETHAIYSIRTWPEGNYRR